MPPFSNIDEKNVDLCSRMYMTTALSFSGFNSNSKKNCFVWKVCSSCSNEYDLCPEKYKSDR